MSEKTSPETQKNEPVEVDRSENDVMESGLFETLESSNPEFLAKEIEAARHDLETAQTELEAVRAELSAANTELESTRDQLMRKAADFDNYRKRTIKEKEELQRFANSNLLTDLVQVLDDFERAIRSSEQARDYDAFHTGIVMIEGQFASMLERKYNLKRFPSLGLEFNPDLHEAVSAEPSKNGDSVVVVEEYQRGYQLHDKVLRTAKVKVGPSVLNGVETSEEKNKEN